MAEVCKANVYLTILDEEIDSYMAKGYSVVDPKTGKILQQSVPTEIGPLKKLYAEQVELNKKLASEIAVLRNKIESLEKSEVTSAESEVASDEDSTIWDDWTDEPTSKKKKPTRNK